MTKLLAVDLHFPLVYIKTVYGQQQTVCDPETLEKVRDPKFNPRYAAYLDSGKLLVESPSLALIFSALNQQGMPIYQGEIKILDFIRNNPNELSVRYRNKVVEPFFPKPKQMKLLAIDLHFDSVHVRTVYEENKQIENVHDPETLEKVAVESRYNPRYAAYILHGDTWKFKQESRSLVSLLLNLESQKLVRREERNKILGFLKDNPGSVTVSYQNNQVGPWLQFGMVQLRDLVRLKPELEQLLDSIKSKLVLNSHQAPTYYVQAAEMLEQFRHQYGLYSGMRREYLETNNYVKVSEFDPALSYVHGINTKTLAIHSLPEPLTEQKAKEVGIDYLKVDSIQANSFKSLLKDIAELKKAVSEGCISREKLEQTWSPLKTRCLNQLVTDDWLKLDALPEELYVHDPSGLFDLDNLEFHTALAGFGNSSVGDLQASGWTHVRL